MARKSGLGKGLDSLIPTEYIKKVDKNRETDENSEHFSTKQGENVDKPVEKNTAVLQNAQMMELSRIEPNRAQPRKNFEEDALDELAESIRQMGLLQPLLVKPQGDHYEIVAGERRWRAAKKAGLRKVPVLIQNYSDQEIMEISLIENIQREDLNVIEEAKAYRKLLDDFGYRQEELADRLSRSRSSITNRLRLLNLAEPVQEMLEEGSLSEGHARALLPLEDPELQTETAKKIVDEKMSVRDTEKWVKKLLHPPVSPKQESEPQPDQVIYDDLEEQLRRITRTKVKIQRKTKDRGRIVIDYYSPEELDRLVELFTEMRGE